MPETIAETPNQEKLARVEIPIDGDVPWAGGVFPVAEIVTAATAASAASQPKMKAAPFRRPFLEPTIRMKMVSATG